MARGVPIARGTSMKTASKKGFDHSLEKLRDSSRDNVHAQWSSSQQLPVSQTNQSRLPLPATQGRVPNDPANARPNVFALVYVDHEGQLQWEMSGKGSNVTREEFCQALVHIMDHGTTEEAPGSNDVAQEPNYHDGRLVGESATVGYDRTIRAVVNKRQTGPKSRIPRTQEADSIALALPPQTLCVQPISQSQGSDAEENNDQDDGYAGAGTLQKQIMVGDEEAMKHYYLTRFKQIQQIPCKSIAKAWIKLIEPKKQVKHPYNGGKKARRMGVLKNGGELTRPDWWPKRGCPHKEPDHQRKEPRLNLLLHMLRDLTNGRVGRDGEEVTVDQLQRSTDEISGSLSEPTRMFLAEVYTVRRQELRYLQKEIDAEEQIFVTLPDREPRLPQRKAKAAPRTKRKQGKSQYVPKPAPIMTRVPSQQHSPTGLISPVSPPSLHDYKQDPPINNKRTTFQSSGGQPPNEGGNTTRFRIVPTFPDQLPFSQMNIDYSQRYGPLISSPVVQDHYYADSTHQDGSGYAFSTKGSAEPLQPLEELQRACTLGISQMFLQTPIQDISWHSPPLPQAGQDLANWALASTPYTPQNTMQMSLPLPLSGQVTNTQQYMSLPLQETSHPYPKDLTLQIPSTSLKNHLPLDPFHMASFGQSNRGLPNACRDNAQQGYFQEQ